MSDPKPGDRVTPEKVTFPRPDFPTNDANAWFDDQERRFWAAVTCPDLQFSAESSVELREFRGKRAPKRLTEIQKAREDAASDLLPALGNALCSVRPLMYRLALARGMAAVLGVEG